MYRKIEDIPEKYKELVSDMQKNGYISFEDEQFFISDEMLIIFEILARTGII